MLVRGTWLTYASLRFCKCSNNAKLYCTRRLKIWHPIKMAGYYYSRACDIWINWLSFRQEL